MGDAVALFWFHGFITDYRLALLADPFVVTFAFHFYRLTEAALRTFYCIGQAQFGVIPIYVNVFPGRCRHQHAYAPIFFYRLLPGTYGLLLGCRRLQSDGNMI